MRKGWSAAAVRELQDESRGWPRYELIDGELLVTSSPGWPHQILISELLMLIAPYVDREKLGVTITSPADLELREGTVTQPDLFVVPAVLGVPAVPGADGTEASWSDIRSLILAVEVISPSSVRTDRVTKRDFYLDNHVAEYWVVDLDARLVERWTPERSVPVLERATVVWQPAPAQSSLDIALPALFDRVRDKETRAGLRRRTRS